MGTDRVTDVDGDEEVTDVNGDEGVMDVDGGKGTIDVNGSGRKTWSSKSVSKPLSSSLVAFCSNIDFALL